MPAPADKGAKMESVQIRQGLRIHFIDNKEDKSLICGHVTPFGFNLLAFKHSKDCECLNCRKVIQSKLKAKGK